MDDQLRAQIYANLRLRETKDLIQIWRQRDLDEWQKETFEIIESILIERIGHLPDPPNEVPIEQVLKRVEDYWKAEKFAKALNECELAIELAPEFADAYYYRGLIYEDLGQSTQAITDYLTAIELDPLLEDAYESVSRIEKRLAEKFQESVAKKHLDQALEYAHNNEPEKAKAEIEWAKRDMPEIAFAYNYTGLILQSLGDLESTIEAYSKAIERNPHFYAARENLANARLELEEKN